MNNNKKYHFKLSLGFLFLISIYGISCQSSEEDNLYIAYEQAKESGIFTDDSLLEDSLLMETEEGVSTKPYKIVVVDPWTKYSSEIEKQIESNEKKIDELRNATGSNGKMIKKIAELEESNQDLQKRLLVFKQEAQASLEKFKLDLKLDLVELEQELKDLSLNIGK